ncbi:protein GVQW3-like [Octopus sinensis]|uniref:Protein GVQW3-like n=1 Tax=Octopus sinensis TaxID=2607531 RepID=A0A6P7SHY9_9MOLL|nr:protein GVQW3-like [Octopus sinensis]
MSLEDDERFGRPVTSFTSGNVEKIHQLVYENRQRTISEIADVVGLSYGSVQTILASELIMWHVSAKFASRLLITEQKEHRIEVRKNIASFMSRDESWVYGCDPETK